MITAGSPPRATTIPFSSIPETNPSRSASPVGDSAIASGRSRSSSSRLSMRKTARWPPESTGLSTAGKGTAASAAVDVGLGPECRERRLRQPGAAERLAHRPLVRQKPGGLGADSGKAELLRDGGDDGHRPVGGHRQHPVRACPASGADHGLHVNEVHDLGDVGGGETRGVAVPVDSRDAQPANTRLFDRAALMPSRADEEDGRHGGRW